MSQARTDRLARPSTSWQHGKPARAATSRLVPVTPQRLLEGSIAATLLRLAAPTVVVMVIQVTVNAAEAAFVGWLGLRRLLASPWSSLSSC